MFKKAFGLLQQVGRSLMLPIALLPAAGILLALGNAMQNPDMIAYLPFLANPYIHSFAVIIEQAGDIIFRNLSLLFAVGVAVGLSEGEGVAGLAAIVGYLIMNVVIGSVAGITSDMIGPQNPAYALVLGIPTLQTGVLGGIIIGFAAAKIYKKYYSIELPSYLGFFAGKRFVPIVTAVAAIAIGFIITWIWPYIQHGIDLFSHNMINSNETASAFVFGVIERSLIPFGLHHIFYNPFWYQFGAYVNKAGQLINGDQSIFFAQMKDGVPFTAGTFMTGKFPFMMFGLPAAALAIYHEAKPEQKALVAGIMGSAALTSFLTGITEPIEFSFLFVAPILFVIHCIFAGFSFMIMQILNIKIGMTFSGGIIDFILFGVLPNRTEWWLVIPIGIFFAILYYFGFRFAIRKWNLKTPGREDIIASDKKEDNFEGSLAANIIYALGGKENIANLDACITRLRIIVNNTDSVDKAKLKSLGASGIMAVGNNLQVIFGTKSDNIKTQMQDILSGKTISPPKTKITESKQENVVPISDEVPLTDKAEGFVSPIDGKILSISEVPDDVFSQKILGDGFAIEPSNGDVFSPVDGKISTVLESKHAVGLISNSGLEIIVHFGIDTVKLSGKGFESFVKEGDDVKAGDKLMKADIDFIKSQGLSIITPVVFTNLENESVTVSEGEEVIHGNKFTLTIK